MTLTVVDDDNDDDDLTITIARIFFEKDEVKMKFKHISMLTYSLLICHKGNETKM